MSDTNKLAKVVELIINNDTQHAEDLLHEVFVSKARHIYEHMQQDEGVKIQPMDTKFITEVGPIASFVLGGTLSMAALWVLRLVIMMLLTWMAKHAKAVTDNKVLIKIVNKLREKNNLSPLQRLTSESLNQTKTAIKNAEKFGLANTDAARAFAQQAIEGLVQAINEICETYGYGKVTISLANEQEPKLITESQVYEINESFEISIKKK